LAISDFPVGWATFTLAIITLVSVIIVYSISSQNLAEIRKQRELLETQVESQIRPRLDLYWGIPTAERATSSNYSVVVRNALGGGPAKDIKVKVSASSGQSGETTIPLLDPGEERRAGQYLHLKHGDTLSVVAKSKDTLDRDCPELTEQFAYD